MKLDKKFVSFYYDGVDEFPDIPLKKDTTMLLIIDYQNEFCDPDSGEAKAFKEAGDWDRWAPYFRRMQEETIPNTRRVLDFFRDHDMLVSYGLIACHRQDGRDRSPVQKTEGWNNMLMPIGSYAAEVVPQLTPKDDEIVVYKTTDSVTTGTNYLHLLDNLGVETVVASRVAVTTQV